MDTSRVAVWRGARLSSRLARLRTTASGSLFAISPMRSTIVNKLSLSITQSALALCEMDFPGYAIGGLSVGETHEEMIGVLDYLSDLLPKDKPRYLMGVGMPKDIIEGVKRGVDMFDCVLPTRNGRNGYAFARSGPIKLRNEQYKRSKEPIDPHCTCYSCTHFTRGYIRHLFMVDEMLGPILASIHNIFFYQALMSRIRKLIQLRSLKQIYEDYPVLSS